MPRAPRDSKENGPYIANRIMRHIRAAWNTALKAHDLPANPTIAVHWNREYRRQEPIASARLPAWFATVSTLEPVIVDNKRVRERSGVRGDYQLFMLLTGLRRMDAATVRWDHVDLEAGTLRRPNTIPLSSECLLILARRAVENREIYLEGDGGWVFPTRGMKDRPCVLCAALGLGDHVADGVVHLIEGKQQRYDKDLGKAKQILPSPHGLRDTYTTALVEVGGISPFAIDVALASRKLMPSRNAVAIRRARWRLTRSHERYASNDRGRIPEETLRDRRAHRSRGAWISPPETKPKIRASSRSAVDGVSCRFLRQVKDLWKAARSPRASVSLSIRSVTIDSVRDCVALVVTSPVSIIDVLVGKLSAQTWAGVLV